MLNKPFQPRSPQKFQATHLYQGQAPEIFKLHNKVKRGVTRPLLYGDVPVWLYTGWHYKKKNYKQLKQEAKQNG